MLAIRQVTAVLLAGPLLACAHGRALRHGDDERPPVFAREATPDDLERRTVERQRGDGVLVESGVAVVLVGGLAAAAGYLAASNNQEPGGALTGGSFVAGTATFGGLCQMAGGLMMIAAGAIDGGVAEYRLRSLKSFSAPRVWIAPTGRPGPARRRVGLTF